MSRSTRHLNYISISHFLTDSNILPTHDAQSIHNLLHYTLDIHSPEIKKLLVYTQIHYGKLLTILLKNNVYACLNLNGKKKNLHHHYIYKFNK